ncbi:hypothetical protein PAMA_010898 [Pampus argenteus]
MLDAAMRERQDMVVSSQALSSAPTAVGITFCASARHTGSFVSVPGTDTCWSSLHDVGRIGLNGGQFPDQQFVVVHTEKNLDGIHPHIPTAIPTDSKHMLSGILLCKSRDSDTKMCSATLTDRGYQVQTLKINNAEKLIYRPNV